MKTFFQLRESVSERVIDAKKMDAYKKFAKANKVDDDSVRMACDNPNHAETKRMMKNKTFAKAVQMYKSAKKESVEEAKKINVYRVTSNKMQGNVHAKDEKEAEKIAKSKGMKGKLTITFKGEYKGQPRLREAKDEFKPHKMYDPETGKAYDADTEADHLRMKKLGYTHEKPNVEEGMTPAEKRAHAKALADFKKRGGKVKKLPPGKAQGYHSKDDLGTDTYGMLDKGDSGKFKKGKKVRSMRAHVEM